MDLPRPYNRILTPAELVRNYPGIEFCNWDQRKIGSLFTAGLFLGNRKAGVAHIIESSFLDLIEFAAQVAEKQAKLIRQMTSQVVEFWTPKELCDEFPQFVRKLDWDASTIGLLHSVGLLNGVRGGKEATAHIVLSSFMELLGYVNLLIKQRTLDL